VQREGNHILYIYKIEAKVGTIRMVSHVGMVHPMYCSGVGKALLAELPDPEIEDIWNSSEITSLTPYTVTSLSDLMDRIRGVREAGYAMDDEENEEGVRCIAVSIPDYHKEPVYALSISAPVSRMTDARIAELSTDVLTFKKDLEKTLGFSRS